MSALPSLGHVNPCLSVAEALRAEGHEVRLAAAPGLAAHIRAAGFTQVNMGFDLPRPGDKFTPELAERFQRWLIGSFGFWVEDLQEHAASWPAELLVHDWSEVAGLAVGAKLGLPSVVLGNALRPPLANVQDSRCWLGVDIDDLGGPANAFGDLLLNFYPPSFAWPGEDRLAHEQFVQPAGYDAAATQAAPHWLADLGDAPLVYVTMGTYYARLPRIMECLIEGAAGVQAQIVMTVGSGRDPEELAPLPSNVRVERYVPQSLLIPHCAAVICQGALSVMMAALSHGVPVGCLPVTWGGPLGYNAAERSAQLGAAMLLPVDGEVFRGAGHGSLAPDRIHNLITTLLKEPSYTGAARRVQGEIASLPSLSEAVPLMEALLG